MLHLNQRIGKLAETKYAPLVVAFLFVILSFGLHMTEGSDSMLNTKNHILAQEELAITVQVHKSVPAFAQRPLTTFLIESFSGVTGAPLGTSFVLVNFFLLFLSGLLLYWLSLELLKNRVQALVSMIVYFLCFSNLFAFFPPVYTYDEPLQFCLIFLSAMCLLRNQMILYVIVFTFVLIARESSLLILPGILLIAYGRRNKEIPLLSRKNSAYLILLGLPIVLYAVFMVSFIRFYQLTEGAIDGFWDRFVGLAENFQNPQFAIESLVSLFLVLGIPIYLLILRMQKEVKKEQKLFLRAFLLTLLLNTLVVFTVTKSREVRLFVVPMFFLWPILGEFLKNELKLIFQWNLYKKVFSKWQYLLVFLMLLGLNYIFSFFAYQTTVSGDSDHYFNEYLFISLILLSIHGLFFFYTNRKEAETLSTP